MKGDDDEQSGFTHSSPCGLPSFPRLLLLPEAVAFSLSRYSVGDFPAS